MKLSVIIPAYNEAENISLTIKDVVDSISGCSDVSDYEVIIIDDHSSDGTFDAISKVDNDKVFGIRLSKRSGSHIAIRTGIDQCTGDVALCISADGQDDPQVLPKMFGEINNGANLVWGVRSNRNEPFLQKVFAKTFYGMLKKLIGQEDSEIDIANADFYILDRKVIQAIRDCKERNSSLFGLLIWIGFDQRQVQYERKERRFGKSKWNMKSRLKLAQDWIIAFSAAPLRLILYFGLIIAFSGFIYALVIMIMALFGLTTPGWAETVIISLLIGGVQMIMLGVIGEYLWRNLDEARKRPYYFIEKDNLRDGQ